MSSREGVVPCAVCTHLRRACTPDCACAPYFPHSDTRFAVVDRAFGASSVANVLAVLAPEQRADAVESIVAKAVACLQRDPVLAEEGKDAGAGTSAPHDRGHGQGQELPNQMTVGAQAADASQRTQPAAVQPGGNGRGVLDGHVHGPSRLETVQRSAPTSKATSSREGVVPCAVCTHLRRRCAPDCACAPYFPHSDRTRFAVVDRVFGASSVANLLAELAPEQRADAVETLVARALMTQRAPVQLGGVRRDVPDGHVQGPPPQQMVPPMAGVPDWSAAEQAAREYTLMLQQHGRPVAPHVHSQQMTRIQNAASKQKAMMDQTAAASEAAARQAALQNYPQLAEQYRARALEAQRRSQLIALQVEEAKKIADAAEQVSRDPDLVLRAALQAAPEQAQRVDAAEEGDIGQLLLMIQQDAAAAGVTEEQYFTMFLQEQQDVAGGGLQQHHGQMHHYVGMGITGNQNTAMNLTTAGQQHHGYLGLEQYQQTQQQHQQHAMHGSGFGATNMTFQTEGPSNADALLLQQQLQSQPQALNVQFQGEQSPSSWLVPLPPQLLPESARQQEKDVVTHGQLQMQMTEGQQAAVVVAHQSPAAEERGQKRGRLDAQAMVNAQREDVMMYGAAAAKKIWDDKLQKITAGFAAAAAGISTNSEDMAQQQVQEEQHNNGEATSAACAASLPPGQQLADVPHQQPNDGGDEGESSDLAACFSVPYPDPPDGRR